MKFRIVLAMVAAIGLSAQVQAEDPDGYLKDVIAGKAKHPPAGLNGARITEPGTRREVCSLLMSYAALIRHSGQTPNDTIRKANAACVNRMVEKGWGKL